MHSSPFLLLRNFAAQRTRDPRPSPLKFLFRLVAPDRGLCLLLRSLLTVCTLCATVLPAAVSITPNAIPPVPAGGAVQLKANKSVTWSLAPGSAGSIDPNGTYHAPAVIAAKNVLGGCQILGNNHIFNVKVDKLPVDPNSAAFMGLIPPSPVAYYPGWGINIIDQSTPLKPMHFMYTPQNDGPFQMTQWPALKREGGVFSDPHSEMDRHEVAIDRQTCEVSEIYNSYNKGDNKACATCTAQSGFHYNSVSATLPSGSVDAASMLLTPLTLGLEEIRMGAIQHALRVTLKNNIIAPHFVWPARTNAGAWGKIPYGTRFRLKAGFDTSKFSPIAQVLLTQLKEYGLILADGGGNWDVSAYTDLTEDPTVEGALGEVFQKGPKSNQFEVVDESSLIQSPDSGAIKSSPYVTPDGYAIAIATSTDNKSELATVPITLQAVTVGVPNPDAWIQAGVTTQLKAWVNGSSEKHLKWTMEPALGTLTADGRFTAPDVERPTTTFLTAASVADPKAFARVGVTVMPKGTIRVNVGNATHAPGAPNKSAPDYGPDSDGNMWWRGQAGEVSWGVINDDWYGEPWPKTKDIQLFYTSRYSSGDMVYSFLVPNGRYKITLMFAQPQCKATFPANWRIPFHLETQGKLVVPNFDMGAGIGNACLTPVVEAIPAVVSDQSLYFALRRVSHGDHMPSPILSAFSIAKDDSAPHLSIAPSKVESLTIGQKIQFKTVGWFMGEQAKWSVVKGPGAITPDGIYTAPTAPPASDQPIVLQAASTSDPSKTATAQMMFKFGKLSVTPGDGTLVRSLSRQFTPSLNGVKYTNVAWTLQPNLGTITPDGVYTAPANLAEDATVSVTAKSKDVATETASATLTLKAKPDTIRIDSGATGGFKDAQGNVWSADTGFSMPSQGQGTKNPIARASPDMQTLYQSSRYRYNNENFAYKFELPNGRYAVTLKFADYTYKEPGHYNFDVVLNGEKVLQNFDFDTVYGPRTAVDKKFETKVTDKTLTIDFLGHKGGASVAGLEIDYLGALAGTP